MNALKSIRKQINEKLEIARQNKEIGSSLEAEFVIYDPKNTLLDKDAQVLEELCIVSRGTIKRSGAEFSIEIKKFDGHKCERCWKFFDDDDGELCGRCRSVVNSLQSSSH